MTKFTNNFSKEIFELTYQYESESLDEFHDRIAKDLAKVEKDKDKWSEKFKQVLEDFKFVPGGRIMSNAGINLKGTTYINCFVDGFQGEDQDSMESIMSALKRQALILKSEGGYGFCADVMRPRGAYIDGIGSESPGAVQMLDMWDTQSKVITMGSGKVSKKGKKKIRKGAQLATLSCFHPDIEEFITAKQTANKLTKFNLSILITDDFITAIKKHKSWNLEFPDYESNKELYKEKWDGNLKLWKEKGFAIKIYKTFEDANELWDLIMQSTYNRNEPGVIFIDTVNRLNNLYYDEYINAANPCAEEILPIGGCCLLGSLNLTQFINGNNWNYEKLKEIIPTIVRMMDNVNDITNVPLEIQRDNLKNKRRIGLGIMGYASALMMMKIRYGSNKALKLTNELMHFIVNASYQSSAMLAKEKGSFLLFDKEKYLNSNFIKKLSDQTRQMIKEHGIRNSHLNTIAPTGNSAVLSNIVSGGLEPVFMPEYTRTAIISFFPEELDKPINIDWNKETFNCKDSTKWEWIKEGDENLLQTEFKNEIWKIDEHRGLTKEVTVKDYSVTHLEEKNEWDSNAEWVSHINNLDIDAHINTMIVFSKYIDASISKTINLPNDYPYEKFKDTYLRLYNSKTVKGVTTYRAGTTASVLKEKNNKKRNGKIIRYSAAERPKNPKCDIHHITAKGQKWIVLIGKLNDLPYEAFAFKENNIDISRSINEGYLSKVKSNTYNLEVPDVISINNITDFFKSDEEEALTRMTSLALRHGIHPKFIFEQLDKSKGDIQSFSKAIGRTIKKYIEDFEKPTSTKCPNCGELDGLIYFEGCVRCKNCSWSQC